jgi:hypothetical protein
MTEKKENCERCGKRDYSITGRNMLIQFNPKYEGRTSCFGCQSVLEGRINNLIRTSEYSKAGRTSQEAMKLALLYKWIGETDPFARDFFNIEADATKLIQEILS